jgi:hypothetical protein
VSHAPACGVFACVRVLVLVRGCVRVCVRVGARAHARACAHVCVRACVIVRAQVYICVCVCMRRVLVQVNAPLRVRVLGSVLVCACVRLCDAHAFACISARVQAHEGARGHANFMARVLASICMRVHVPVCTCAYA